MNPPPPTPASHSDEVTARALREQYESGATVDELVASSGLSYGTVLNRLHDVGTVMRTSWQTRRMRQDAQARKRLAAHLRTLYEQHGATLTELSAVAGETRRAARRLLIEAGGSVRTTQQTLRMRSAARAAGRQKLAMSLRTRYEAGSTVPELAKECSYSSKHHLICDGRGTPLHVITTAAYVNDITQTLNLIDGIPSVAGRPGRPRRRPVSVLGDKAYDSRAVRRELRKRRIKPVISRKGAPNIKGLGKLRYVVEQTFALLHQFKRLAVRWERRPELHDAFLSLARSLICWRRLKKTGT